MKKRILCRQKKGCKNFLAAYPPPVSLFITFFVNFPPSCLMRYFLNGPLGAHLEPCQTSAKGGYQACKHIRYLRTASILNMWARKDIKQARMLKARAVSTRVLNACKHASTSSTQTCKHATTPSMQYRAGSGYFYWAFDQSVKI